MRTPSERARVQRHGKPHIIYADGHWVAFGSTAVGFVMRERYIRAIDWCIERNRQKHGTR